MQKVKMTMDMSHLSRNLHREVAIKEIVRIK